MVYKITAKADGHYVDEMRQSPFRADRSPGLQRILNLMRIHRGGDQYIMIARREFHDFVIARMPPSRDDPIVVETDQVYSTPEAVEWELFCRRWEQHTGEVIDRTHDGQPCAAR